jgi:hypothetical protein
MATGTKNKSTAHPAGRKSGEPQVGPVNWDIERSVAWANMSLSLVSLGRGSDLVGVEFVDLVDSSLVIRSLTSTFCVITPHLSRKSAYSA